MFLGTKIQLFFDITKFWNIYSIFYIPKLRRFNFAPKKWGKKYIDNICPPFAFFSQKIWRVRKKCVSLSPKSVKNKYIDNIRPPKVAEA